MSEEKYAPLSAFVVSYSDGRSRVVNMAAGITLKQARLYFVGNWFEFNESEPTVQCTGVELFTEPCNGREYKNYG
jgi:hypothetical protein